MSDKFHHFMFCYTWYANSQNGSGYQILHNDQKLIVNKDIKDANSFIQDEIQKKFQHDKNAIQVIITNIIHLNYCTKDEFWGDGS